MLQMPSWPSHQMSSNKSTPCLAAGLKSKWLLQRTWSQISHFWIQSGDFAVLDCLCVCRILWRHCLPRTHGLCPANTTRLPGNGPQMANMLGLRRLCLSVRSSPSFAQVHLEWCHFDSFHDDPVQNEEQACISVTRCGLLGTCSCAPIGCSEGRRLSDKAACLKDFTAEYHSACQQQPFCSPFVGAGIGQLKSNPVPAHAAGGHFVHNSPSPLSNWNCLMVWPS